MPVDPSPRRVEGGSDTLWSRKTCEVCGKKCCGCSALLVWGSGTIRVGAARRSHASNQTVRRKPLEYTRRAARRSHTVILPENGNDTKRKETVQPVVGSRWALRPYVYFFEQFSRALLLGRWVENTSRSKMSHTAHKKYEKIRKI